MMVLACIHSCLVDSHRATSHCQAASLPCNGLGPLALGPRVSAAVVKSLVVNCFPLGWIRHANVRVRELQLVSG